MLTGVCPTFVRVDRTQTSQANATTTCPERYGKQLASHFSRKVEAEWSDADREGASNFQAHDGIGGARCTLSAGEGVLHMRIGGTSDAVERFEPVVGSRLVRFGARDGLVVQWQRDNGPGQSFTASEPDVPSR